MPLKSYLLIDIGPIYYLIAETMSIEDIFYWTLFLVLVLAFRYTLWYHLLRPEGLGFFSFKPRKKDTKDTKGS